MPTMSLTLDHAIGIALLSLATLLVWRALKPAPKAVPVRAPSARSGFTRWLTPMALPVMHASGAATRALTVSKKSHAAKPVVRRTAVKLLASTGAEARDIARRTGMSRDAVAMMMASGSAAAPAMKSTVRAAAAARKVAAAERTMQAPARGIAELRASRRDRQDKGTKFQAFVR
jgi:hypothetical protein